MRLSPHVRVTLQTQIRSDSIRGKKKKKQQPVFPGSSAGKESTCNAGDSGLIPGLERFTGEGIGYPLQYSQAFLVA